MWVVLALGMVLVVALIMPKWRGAPCRDCGFRILAHTIHECPKSGKRYTAR